MYFFGGKIGLTKQDARHISAPLVRQIRDQDLKSYLNSTLCTWSLFYFIKLLIQFVFEWFWPQIVIICRKIFPFPPLLLCDFVTFNAHISIIVLYHLHFSCILLPFSCVPLHVAVSGCVRLRRVLWCCVRGCSPLLGVDSCTFFFLGSQTGPCSDPNCCGLTSQQHASVLKKRGPLFVAGC